MSLIKGLNEPDSRFYKSLVKALQSLINAFYEACQA